MERKDNYNEIEELLGKDIQVSASNDEIEMSETSTSIPSGWSKTGDDENDPYGNVCISCEG